ncbi:hypothetical protein B0O99DRAFT_95243 [Bisporella sp. PMI_857]|nr:hypothetical protein B0O99DRAFT_95243 [Bisporella sp. PMI_857]
MISDSISYIHVRVELIESPFYQPYPCSRTQERLDHFTFTISYLISLAIRILSDFHQQRKPSPRRIYKSIHLNVSFMMSDTICNTATFASFWRPAPDSPVLCPKPPKTERLEYNELIIGKIFLFVTITPESSENIPSAFGGYIATIAIAMII